MFGEGLAVARRAAYLGAIEVPVVARIRYTLSATLAGVREGRRPDAGHLMAAAKEVVALVGRFRWVRFEDDGPTAVMLNAFSSLYSRPGFFSLEDHHLNVAVLAAQLGRELFGEGERLVQLALAALVHDVGMCLLPSSVIYKPGPLAPEEMRLLHHHPINSASIVETWGEPFAEIAGILAQEHEREDASGYPWGLPGCEISLEARILGLADTYEAMTHHRPYRPARCPHEAMKVFLTSASPLFGLQSQQLIIRRFSMYPLGIVVELNSLDMGVVVGLNHDDPMRPQVLVVGNQDVWKASGPRVVDLREERLLHIRRCVPSPVSESLVVPEPPSAL